VYFSSKENLLGGGCDFTISLLDWVLPQNKQFIRFRSSFWFQWILLQNNFLSIFKLYIFGSFKIFTLLLTKKKKDFYPFIQFHVACHALNIYKSENKNIIYEILKYDKKNTKIWILKRLNWHYWIYHHFFPLIEKNIK
jgi:hypothetical protein